MLKFLLFILLITGPIIAGFAQDHYINIFILAFAFTIAKIADKLKIINITKERYKNPINIIKDFCIWYFIQCVVVSLFFYLSFGISAAFFNPDISSTIVQMAIISSYASGTLCLTYKIWSLKFKKPKIEDGPCLKSLEDELDAMADLQVIMPAEIFKLARQFTEIKDRTSACNFMDKKYSELTNHFQKRVFFTFIRFAEQDEIGVFMNLEKFIFEGLNDEMVWVQYDAAWAAKDLGNMYPQITNKLKELSQMEIMNEEDKAQISLKSKAQEVLDSFEM